jgi:biotin-dependent carboxylase-like uncharacterized protein
LKPGLLVINPGLCTTVQDTGRPGYREWGVAPGGAFDRRSLGLANALLGNRPDAAALELTLFGGVYEAAANLAIALAGAPMDASIEPRGGITRRLQIPQSASIAQGDRLIFGSTPLGARTYLAVKGGWQTDVMLGSRSSERRLTSGGLVPALPGSTLVRRPAHGHLQNPCAGPLRLINGPDTARVQLASDLLERNTFCVGQLSDRTGLRLEGPPVPIQGDPERISAPVAPGAIQVTGESLLLLGIACGTMGGYPHVAHVISADLDRVGQLRPGDLIRFKRVSLEDARALDRADREKWESWLAAVAALPRGEKAN